MNKCDLESLRNKIKKHIATLKYLDGRMKERRDYIFEVDWLKVAWKATAVETMNMMEEFFAGVDEYKKGIRG